MHAVNAFLESLQLIAIMAAGTALFIAAGFAIAKQDALDDADNCGNDDAMSAGEDQDYRSGGGARDAKHDATACGRGGRGRDPAIRSPDMPLYPD